MVRVLGIVALVCAVALIVIPSGIAILIGSPDRDGQEPVAVSVYNHLTGKVMYMTLQEYLVGVVAAEMPASFEYEALKAQAVAARTYCLRKMAENRDNPVPEHYGADICTDPGHCQAWCSREDLARTWGLGSYVQNARKVISAVAETDGLVITWGGSLIDAVYHSCCGGMTEDAYEVWGRRVSYLQPVPCQCSQRGAELYDTKTVTYSQLLRALGMAGAAIPVTAQAVTVMATSGANRARVISVCGKMVPANDLRRALGLKSTRITVRPIQSGVSFTTVGYGHGVGMCQWGANYMAASGAKFNEILQHYYTGAMLASVIPVR